MKSLNSRNAAPVSLLLPEQLLALDQQFADIDDIPTVV